MRVINTIVSIMHIIENMWKIHSANLVQTAFLNLILNCLMINLVYFYTIVNDQLKIIVGFHVFPICIIETFVVGKHRNLFNRANVRYLKELIEFMKTYSC